MSSGSRSLTLAVLHLIFLSLSMKFCSSLPFEALPNSMRRLIKSTTVNFSGLTVAVFVFTILTANAQSTNISLPTPVKSFEVTGTIVARDIGDARLTDHYYAFMGTPGDLLVTVESSNLDGDVDVFTAGGLRPLMKFSVYSGSASQLTKSVFLRTTEQLILRVEARTPNDEPGTYRLRFGGAFEAITSGPLVEAEARAAEAAATETASVPQKGRRVSSVGARIEEPPEPEVAAAPTPEPTPVETPTETPAAETKTATTTPPRTRRGRRLPGRRTRTPPPAEEETTAKTEPETTTPTTEAEPETKPTPRGRRSARRGNRTEPVTPPPQEPEVESGPKLVIETTDGTFIDRYMSTVRRVTVENGVIVVVGKDGKISRVPLVNVVRMSIAP